MSRKVLLDLSVADVHAPGAMGTYAAGYSLGKANGAGADLQHAALAIVRDPTGRVLTVSRPEPPHEQAIPGGLVEPGETAGHAAIRELQEECGIDCHALFHVCDIVSPTDGRTVHVFRCDTWSGDACPNEPGTKIAWLMPGDLMAQAKRYRPSLQAISNAGGLDMPKKPTRTASDRRRNLRTMAEISTKTRNALPETVFALPAQRKYPLENADHVRNAAARLAQAKKKGKISDSDYATAHAAIAKAEKKFGIVSAETTASDSPARPRMHHFQISADLAHGGSLHVEHASLSDPGGVAFMPGVPVVGGLAYIAPTEKT